MSSTTKIVVSIIVPILNEEKYIQEFLNSVLQQDFDKNLYELLLIDGMSVDNTRKIVKNYFDKFKFIRILDNPKKIIPCALNIGIKESFGKYIVRMDAHTYYCPDYVSQCVNFIKSGKYQNVGGPVVVGYKSRIQKIIAASNYSKFALGGGKHHIKNYEGLSDTVSFGTFKKDYLSMYMYDENIKFAEDDDLNFRILENGGKIFISPKIRFIYYPRSSFKSMFVQYFRYGMWKVAVIKKHKKPARISHLIPVCFLLFLIFSLISPFFYRDFFYISIPVLSLYIILSTYFSFKNKILDNFYEKILLVFTHFLIHFSYGLGSLFGFFKFFGKRIDNPSVFKKIDLSKNDIKNLQLKSLELILNFKRFCNANGLKFFLCGGGCIGAVRHSGFIPWDDDLDVFMLRKDYEKLCKTDCSKEKFRIFRTNKEVFTGQTFTLVSDRNSTLIKREQIGLKIPRGVSIDVFPLDGCPKNKVLQLIQMTNACLFSLYITRMVPKNHGLLIKILGKILLWIIPSDKIKFKIAYFCEKKMSKYQVENCDYVKELCAGPKYMKNIYNKKIFNSCIMKKFEGNLLPIPAGYDNYLKTAFGDYMKLPPEKDRITPHDIVFIDLENPCKNYKNQF